MGRLAFVLALATVVACARGSGEDPPAIDSPPRQIDATIDGNGCPVQPCTILPQCGCIGTSACDLNPMAGAGTACRTIGTLGHETTACDSLDDCDKGYVCLGGTAASCKKYCMNDSDCGTPRGRCALDISIGGQPVAGIPPACTSNCDPVSTNPPECPSKYKCVGVTLTHNTMSVPAAVCVDSGAGGQGADCKMGANGNDALCNKSFLCTTTDGGSTFKCRRYCTNPGTAASTQCSNQACLAFATPFTLAGVSYGVCAP